MAYQSDIAKLREIARRLSTSGPHKIYQAHPRRIRIIHAGLTIADTTKALYVWEHPYYPVFYLPWDGIRGPNEDKGETYPQWEERGVLTAGRADGASEVHENSADSGSSSSGDVLGRLWRIHVSGDEKEAIDNVYETTAATPQIGNMLRIPFLAAAHWLEEDTPILVHPKDPFKRIDTMHSLRPVKISLRGQVLAESSYSVHLYETGLPCRYYMPLSAIDPTVLRRSEKRSECPYKGEAEYYDVVLKGEDGKEEVHEGLVWYYNRPTMESAMVAGLCCFYNEKVDVEVGGVREERPRTQFG